MRQPILKKIVVIIAVLLMFAIIGAAVSAWWLFSHARVITVLQP